MVRVLVPGARPSKSPISCTTAQMCSPLFQGISNDCLEMGRALRQVVPTCTATVTAKVCGPLFKELQQLLGKGACLEGSGPHLHYDAHSCVQETLTSLNRVMEKGACLECGGPQLHRDACGCCDALEEEEDYTSVQPSRVDQMTHNHPQHN